MRDCIYTSCAALLVLICGSVILLAIAAALWDMIQMIPFTLMLGLSLIGVMAALIKHKEED